MVKTPRPSSRTRARRSRPRCSAPRPSSTRSSPARSDRQEGYAERLCSPLIYGLVEGVIKEDRHPRVPETSTATAGSGPGHTGRYNVSRYLNLGIAAALLCSAGIIAGGTAAVADPPGTVQVLLTDPN